MQLQETPENGGFPAPPTGEPVRVVTARHARCGAETRVRLPRAVPARAVRRLRCAGCAESFEASAEEIAIEAAGAVEPAIEPAAVPAAEPAGDAGTARPAARRRGLRARRPKLPAFDPQGRFWRLASIPIAAGAVIAALLLIQGGGDEEPAAPAPPAEPAVSPAAGAAAEGKPSAKGAGKASLVQGDSWSLALPAGWERVQPQAGATFAAAAPGGAADATLWVERDPQLDFPAFVARSLDQLRSLAGSARVAQRLPAPTPDATIVRLAADAPPGQPLYEVTLRATGPYRYYLATTVQPDADNDAAQGAELIAGSLVPQPGGAR